VSQRRAAASLSILHVVSRRRRHSAAAVAALEHTRHRGEATPLQAATAPAMANREEEES
jgi:hypothetical protein